MAWEHAGLVSGPDPTAPLVGRAADGTITVRLAAPAAVQGPIADVPTSTNATAADNADAINSILASLRAYGLIAT